MLLKILICSHIKILIHVCSHIPGTCACILASPSPEIFPFFVCSCLVDASFDSVSCLGCVCSWQGWIVSAHTQREAHTRAWWDPWLWLQEMAEKFSGMTLSLYYVYMYMYMYWWFVCARLLLLLLCCMFLLGAKQCFILSILLYLFLIDFSCMNTI